MSLSKKKFSFHRKKSENKGNNNNNQEQIYKNENNKDIKENNQTNLNKNISIDELLCKNNKKENINEELISLITKNKSMLNVEEKEDINNNPGLLYLMHQNETENIDFISTLLKLKGIQTNSNKNYKSLKNINFSQNLENENVLKTKNSSKNNNIILKNISKYNKSIPLYYSPSNSKVNTINNNNNNNHHNNDEEEILKNLNSVTFSTNEIYDNINNMNNSNISKITNKLNLTKTEQNILINDLTTTLDNEIDKGKYTKNHTNKDTASTFECNTNNSSKRNFSKNDNEFMNSREYYQNIKIPENNNKNISKIFENKNKDKNYKIKSRQIIPNKGVKSNKSFYKKTINNKNFKNTRLQKSEGKQKEHNSIATEKKLLNKKSIKTIPHNKKQFYEINNNINSINAYKQNSKDKISKSKNSHMEESDKNNRSR